MYNRKSHPFKNTEPQRPQPYTLTPDQVREEFRKFTEEARKFQRQQSQEFFSHDYGYVKLDTSKKDLTLPNQDDRYEILKRFEDIDDAEIKRLKEYNDSLPKFEAWNDEDGYVSRPFNRITMLGRSGRMNTQNVIIRRDEVRETNSKMNGHMNGHMNGNLNGHMNGYANGHVNGLVNGFSDYHDFNGYDDQNHYMNADDCDDDISLLDEMRNDTTFADVTTEPAYSDPDNCRKSPSNDSQMCVDDINQLVESDCDYNERVSPPSDNNDFININAIESFTIHEDEPIVINTTPEPQTISKMPEEKPNDVRKFAFRKIANITESDPNDAFLKEKSLLSKADLVMK
jgi:hypothetical protein